MTTSLKLSANSICSFSSDPPAPTVLEATGGHQLYPIPEHSGRPWKFTLEVKYSEMNDEQLIRVTIKTERLDDIILPDKVGSNTDGYVHFDLDEELIGKLIDSEAYIFYSVISGSLSIQSQVLSLTVQRILDKHQPVPVLPDAKDQVLDLREIRQLIRCQLGPLPYAAPGMTVWFQLEGLDEDSKHIDHDVIQGRKMTVHEVLNGIDEILDRDFLHLFQDYSGLTLIFWIDYKGGTDKNNATEIRRDTYRIRQVQHARLVKENFETVPRKLINAGQSAAANSIEIKLLAGSNGQAGIDTYAYVMPGMRVGHSVVLCRNIHSDEDQQKLLVTFAEPLTRLKFAITWVHFYLRCELYDKKGNLLDDLELVGWSNVWADFSAGEGIKTMIVHARDHAFLDFFSMWVKP